MEFKAQQAGVKSLAMARTADGFPKLNEKESVLYWPMLDAEDRKYLKQKYSLDLEI